jgi:hypothetical protein
LAAWQVIWKTRAGYTINDTLTYEPRPFGPISGDDDYDDEEDEEDDPLPHLSGVCHICGAEVECYDDLGVDWCLRHRARPIAPTWASSLLSLWPRRP